MNRAEKRRQRKKTRKATKHAKPGQAPNHSPGQQRPATRQDIDLALAHHTAGRLPEAEAIYRRILQADPNQPVILNLLGAIASQEGKNDIAVELITKALAIKPDFAKAHNNLGVALQELGRLDDAVASCQKALAIKPDYAEAYINLGNARLEQGKPDEAAASYRMALAIKPDFTVAHYNLGNALRELDKPDEAVASYRKALAIEPDFAETHHNLGNALLEQGKPDEAVASYRKALAINPDYDEAHYNLGNALLELEKLDEAIASYRKALAIKPDFAEAHNNLGNAFKSLGKLDEAVASYRMALAIKPDYAEAHRHMTIVVKHSQYGDDIKEMEEIFARPDATDDERMHLAFGLGKAFEDLQLYEKAFDFFVVGNAYKRKTFDYRTEEWSTYVKRLKTVFDGALFARHRAVGWPDETPIFILGMPRSGTTLVEQILASHTDVHAAGELPTLGNTIAACVDMAKYPEIIQLIEDDAFKRMGNAYSHAIGEKINKARFVTDKMPNNFECIGMIKLMLPKAKIIHCKRCAKDTCLSIFKNYFSRKGYKYAYDLIELGLYHKSYRDMMAHWHNVLPGFILDIQYEEIVTGQEQQTKALLEYCGLEWEDACLDFHKTDRPVKTASAAQVRRPIYRDSVQSWKRYKKQLAPLIESLR